MINQSLFSIALGLATFGASADAATKVVCADRVSRAPRFAIELEGPSATVTFERTIALQFARDLGLVAGSIYDVTVKATIPSNACAVSETLPLGRCSRQFDRPGSDDVVQAWSRGALVKELPLRYLNADLVRVVRTHVGGATQSHVELTLSIHAVEGERRAYATTKFDYGQGYECQTR